MMPTPPKKELHIVVQAIVMIAITVLCFGAFYIYGLATAPR